MINKKVDTRIWQASIDSSGWKFTLWGMRLGRCCGRQESLLTLARRGTGRDCGPDSPRWAALLVRRAGQHSHTAPLTSSTATLSTLSRKHGHNTLSKPMINQRNVKSLCVFTKRVIDSTRTRDCISVGILKKRDLPELYQCVYIPCIGRAGLSGRAAFLAGVRAGESGSPGQPRPACTHRLTHIIRLTASRPAPALPRPRPLQPNQNIPSVLYHTKSETRYIWMRTSGPEALALALGVELESKACLFFVVFFCSFSCL